MKEAGKTFVILITPTLPASGAYTSGDVVGSNAPFALTQAIRAQGFGGVITSLVVADNAGQSLALDISFFRARPTSTFTDNAAVALSAADNLKHIGTVSLAATDYTTLGSGIAQATKECMLPFNLIESGEILWAVIVTRGAPTYSAASLQIAVGLLQD